MARRLCSACNADWQRGECRRNVLLLAIGAATFMATLFALYLAIPAAGGNGLFIFIPVLTAAIAMRIADTVFRARFRRTGPLPAAAMRR